MAKKATKPTTDKKELKRAEDTWVWFTKLVTYSTVITAVVLLVMAVTLV